MEELYDLVFFANDGDEAKDIGLQERIRSFRFAPAAPHPLSLFSVRPRVHDQGSNVHTVFV